MASHLGRRRQVHRIVPIRGRKAVLLLERVGRNLTSGVARGKGLRRHLEIVLRGRLTSGPVLSVHNVAWRSMWELHRVNMVSRVCMLQKCSRHLRLCLLLLRMLRLRLLLWRRRLVVSSRASTSHGSHTLPISCPSSRTHRPSLIMTLRSSSILRIGLAETLVACLILIISCRLLESLLLLSLSRRSMVGCGRGPASSSTTSAGHHERTGWVSKLTPLWPLPVGIGCYFSATNTCYFFFFSGDFFEAVFGDRIASNRRLFQDRLVVWTSVAIF